MQLAALNTMGVLYIVEAGESIQSVADLKGKTIYSTGQGSTPEYALNLVLEKNGLTVGEDVTVVYKTDNSEIAPLLASGEAQVALLPQPFVTSVMGQNETLRVALDMTEEWDKDKQTAALSNATRHLFRMLNNSFVCSEDIIIELFLIRSLYGLHALPLELSCQQPEPFFLQLQVPWLQQDFLWFQAQFPQQA